MHKILLISFLISFNVNAIVLFSNNQSEYLDQIYSNAPSLPASYAQKLINAASNASMKHSVPIRFILAIAFIESSYRLNAYNPKSNDFGLMQINKWHVKRSKLDKTRLLTDMYYNMDHGARIFSWFYRKYPLEEAVGRYNCGTRKSCINNKAVLQYVDRFLTAL